MPRRLPELRDMVAWNQADYTGDRGGNEALGRVTAGVSYRPVWSAERSTCRKCPVRVRAAR
jgi:hypothetical protein